MYGDIPSVDSVISLYEREMSLVTSQPLEWGLPEQVLRILEGSRVGAGVSPEPCAAWDHKCDQGSLRGWGDRRLGSVETQVSSPGQSHIQETSLLQEVPRAYTVPSADLSSCLKTTGTSG